jgi:choline dehydrogenase-like flavoprotein
VRFTDDSDYAKRGAAQIPRMVDTLAAALPIERIALTAMGDTAAQIQGAVLMGTDPATSIVDRYQVHHQYRNLLVPGASAFPTVSPAYSTLTLSALGLWAAEQVLGTSG